MKTTRLVLVSIFCLVFILTPLSVITGCKADEPSGYPLQAGAPLRGAISSAGLDLVLGSLVKGALSWAGGESAGFLFGLITGSGDEGANLDTIKDQLDDMDKTLNDIKGIVEDIQKKVDGISTKLKIIEWNIAVLSIADALTTINETFDMVMRLSESAKENILDLDHPDRYEKDQEDVITYSKTDGVILDPTTGVIHAVGKIAAMMTGEQGGTGLLELRRQQIMQGLNYNNGADSYDAFALFFTAVLGWEIKGVELIVNAYGGQDRPDLAVLYLKDFYKNKLAPQVKVFSSRVEKIVWENNDMSWSEVILDPEPYIFPSADYLADTLLNSYYVDEEGKLKVGENKGIITVRVRYSDATAPLGAIKLINTSANPQQIITVQSEEPTKTEETYKVRVYKYSGPSNGTYALYTKDHPDILHDYGEKEIVITDENKYGYIGVYAWKPSSDYYQITTRNKSKGDEDKSGKPIEATGAGDRANVQLWLYYGFDNQLWKFEHIGDGYYKITNKYSKKVLDVLSYSKEDKANVIQYKWSNTDNQKWRLHLIENGYLKIISKNSGKVLEVEGGRTANGANIQQNQWRHSGGQHWELIPESRDDKKLWKFIPKINSDFRLDVRGGLGQGSVIQAFKKNNTWAQKWYLDRKSGKYYRLTPKCDEDTAASIRNSYTHSGAIVQTWGYKKNDDNFLWYFVPAGSGYYRIVNKNSGMSMQWRGDAVKQVKYGDLSKKEKDTAKWRIIKTSVK